MSLYSDLGLSETATPADIKRAYFAGVRRCSPETDPVGYQRIRSAYETLADETTRRSYDARMKHGDRLDALEEQADKAMQEEEWASAEAKLKEILLLDADREDSRNRLALALAYQGKFEPALKALEPAIRRNPTQTNFRMNRGHILVAMAQEREEPRYLRLALEEFREIVAREPHHSDAWLAKSRAELRLDELGAAWQSAQKAVEADGVEDVADLEAFFFLMVLSVRQERPDRTAAISARVAAVVANNADAKDYAFSRILALAEQLQDAQRFSALADMLDAALRIKPDGRDKLDPVRSWARRIAAAEHEFELLSRDETMPKVFVLVVNLLLRMEAGEELQGDLKKFIDIGIPNYAVTEPDELLESISRTKQRFPALSQVLAQKFDVVTGIAGPASAQRQQSAASSSSGCAVILCASGLGLVGLAAAAGKCLQQLLA